MSFEEELKKMGYKFEYAQDEGGDRAEVWLNEEGGMAVRIEWMKVDEEGWRVSNPASKGAGKVPVGKPQRNRHCDDDVATSGTGARVLP